jgi:hypothetical protein
MRDAVDQLGCQGGTLMTCKMILATGCIVLTLGSWTNAAQLGGTDTNPGSTQPAPSGSGVGDPSTHGTTDRAGQTPEPTGTGGTAATQGKGGSGKATNGSSDKKGKRKSKHDKGDDKGAKSAK